MRKFVKYRKAAYAAMEREILDVWRKGGVFQASVDSRPAEKTYVFYDGPPFITGLPHHGTLLSSIVKDVVPRFKTMQGCRVERRWGWDCHGLPAENYVEKKLALEDKRAVLSYGLEKYITACRESMIQTGSLWEESIDRIGRWVEFQGAYKTMDASYMESVWWAFKRLYETGKVYEGEKVLVYCTRCATPVSKAEVAMDNSYRQVRDPSVYVKFSLPGEVRDAWLKRVGYDREPVAGLSLLAWTTTPWTLPANTAAAVNPELDYALVVFGEACYILAAESVGRVFTDETGQSLNLAPAGVFKGRELVGLVYEPLFEDRGSGAHRVLGADYVTTEDGSGIVHLAPAYGEEDYELAEAQGVPIVKNIDENGLYEAGPWRGRDAWEANEDIARSLLAEGKVLKLTEFDHSYPHCHRCGTRLMYRAHPSWFFDIGAVREQLLADNQSINWFPDHIKEGRFKAIIETAPDWNLSRDRFWATPLPVWRGVDPASGEEKTIVVGSYDELEELSGRRLEDYHRPWVDEIEFERDGVTYRRVDKVLDCWFESGSMPFAQYHYPFENKEFFDRNFPADFIVEYVGQVRAWFYYLHVIGVALFSKPAFTNVIVTGTILGSDGRKISKSLGNYTDPLELTDKYSADAYRLVLVDSPVLAGEDFSLTDKDVADKQRKLDTLRNTLEFFLLYAAADEWQADPGRHSSPPEPTNFFDRWLLVRLSELTAELTGGLENYDLPAATRPLQEFIDDLSNWYVRRNRKRFWKTDASADKEAAYHTLYF
ncbi:isoleucine--tRNA ligase, partial [Candidatus Saccharibacteria bacterium]|nr:isoleucine--tRNA ligase [Candidatus Saccharibacteria bacterium]